jgi:hypothetical protein
MKRMHVAVENLKQAFGFFSVLVAAQPSVIKPDDAKWMLDDPRVSLVVRCGAARWASIISVFRMRLLKYRRARTKGVSSSRNRRAAATRGQKSLGLTACRFGVPGGQRSYLLPSSVSASWRRSSPAGIRRLRPSQNTLLTRAILVVPILISGPPSGAHFKPAVSLAFALGLGGLIGVWAANICASCQRGNDTARSGTGPWLVALFDREQRTSRRSSIRSRNR